MKLAAKARLVAAKPAFRPVFPQDKELCQQVKTAVAGLCKKYKVKRPDYLGGWCDVFCADLLKNRLVPPEYKAYSTFCAEDEHVVLMDPKSGRIIDPAGNQFENDLISYKGDGYNGYKKWYRLSAKELEDIRQEALLHLAEQEAQ